MGEEFDLVEAVLKVLPVLSGGLAGAIFTYLVGRWTAGKRQRRLRVETRQTKYALPGGGKTESLRIAYSGVEYEALMLFEMRAVNTSALVISENPFVIEIPSGARVLDQGATMEPVGELSSTNRDALKANQYRYTFGALHPRDTISIWMLLAEVAERPVVYHYRGKDDVVITDSQVSEQDTYTDDVRGIVLLMALYVLCGALEVYLLIVFSRALIILFSSRYVVRIYSRWAERYEQRVLSKSGNSTINVAGHIGAVTLGEAVRPAGLGTAAGHNILHASGPFIGSRVESTSQMVSGIAPPKPPRKDGLADLPNPPK